MAAAPGADRPRRFFDRLTEPIADRAREKFEQAEDHVREALQSEIDAVTRSVRTRAIEVRPSAVGFAAASLLGFFGLSLLITSAVLGLSHAVEPWLSALLVGVALLLVAGGLAAWAKRRLPAGPPLSVRVHEPVHPAEEQVHPWAD
ncbi:phage holin family protein [Cellulomonas fengjieae]|uniref:Phage holin family protein n=1 Tax=Cellulomonas fengjieae TaxID=2819978 RepID=A0ABS3SC26_9CELL|nr:phage holin family protein [Cellulomonas fengjieae]MBO3083307.1 phage holin family protein [Cellulomonas fengjieae]MBO3101945.1 phage holin family protein [Cellulomonas fengjieae]QVI65344.1 phage holin family protein [Cellulomonas fengjieae]